MPRTLFYAAAALVAGHGLIHLMGFAAYWPLAAIAELPYRTDLAGGRWDVSGAGMKLYAALWLLTALGFLLATVGLLTRQGWWQAVMIGTAVLSTALIALNWAPAFRGAVVNAGILAVMAVAFLLSRGVAAG